jgi:hypothetical protein
MKNLIKKIIMVLSISVLLMACNETESLDEKVESSILEKNRIENATLNQKIDYTNYHLLEIGKIISNLSENKSFTEKLFSSIDKKNNENGKSEIQLRDLIKIINADKDLSQKEEEISLINKELEAFYDLDGQDWHPAIYISNFEEKYKRIMNKSYDTSKPLIVPVVYENDDELVEDRYKAYQENNNGILEELDFDVSESESVGYNNLYFLRISEEHDVDSNASSNTTTYPNEPNSFLKRMKVKYHKESAGRSEVEVKTRLESIYNQSYITSRTKYFSYKRRWIRRKYWKTKNENFTIYSNQGIFPESGALFSWVIYEWDSWPAPEKECTITHTLPNGTTYTRTEKFHSWQSEYDKGAISTFQNQSLWYFGNSGISYEFEKKYTY